MLPGTPSSCCSTATRPAPWASLRTRASTRRSGLQAPSSGSMPRAGRRATLVTTGTGGIVVDLCSLDGFGEALDCLAAVEPDAPSSLARALGHAQTPAARAGELVVVTATLDPRVARSGARRRCTSARLGRLGRRPQLRGAADPRRARPPPALVCGSAGCRSSPRGRPRGGPRLGPPGGGGAWVGRSQPAPSRR